MYHLVYLHQFTVMHNKSVQTKQHILTTSARVFNTHGYQNASIDDICRATGLTRGAIYSYFRDKEDLASAAFHWYTDFILSQFRKKIAQSVGVTAKIMALLTFYSEYNQQLITDGSCPFIKAGAEWSAGPETKKKNILEALEQWTTLVSDILTDGQKSGEINPEIDVAEYALLFVSMIEGALFFTQLMKQPAPLLTTFRQIGLIIERDLNHPKI